jgi:DNA polymerase (family 10)
MSRNQEVAAHLRTIAQLMGLEKTPRFKIVAFENAAKTVETLSGPVENANLDAIPGIGDSIATTIRQFLSGGVSMRLQDLGTRWPVEALTMTRVDGVGPVTAMKLHSQGIKNFDELVAAGTAGKLNEKLAKAVRFAAAYDVGRIPREVATEAALFVTRELMKIHGVSTVQVCGSVRRNAETSKDVDVVITTLADADEGAILVAFQKLGDKIDGRSIRIAVSGAFVQVDLWIVEPWHFGAAVVYATGSKDHCVALRTLAKSKGLTLNEYGLFKAGETDFFQKNQVAPSATETEVYSSLGLRFFAPEERSGDLS